MKMLKSHRIMTVAGLIALVCAIGIFILAIIGLSSWRSVVFDVGALALILMLIIAVSRSSMRRDRRIDRALEELARTRKELHKVSRAADDNTSADELAKIRSQVEAAVKATQVGTGLSQYARGSAENLITQESQWKQYSAAQRWLLERSSTAPATLGLNTRRGNSTDYAS